MPIAEFQYYGRLILSLRRDNTVHHHSTTSSLDATAASDSSFSSAVAVDNTEALEKFQNLILDCFQELSNASGDEMLSLSWIRNLLDSFLGFQDEFRAILFNNRDFVNKPPFDKMIADYYDRCVKAMDICNAVRGGIDHLRQLERLSEIVLCTLDKQTSNSDCFWEGQLRRANRALVELSIGILDEKDATNSNRNRSFTRKEQSSRNGYQHMFSRFRSLSWSVSRSWSAAKQLQAIGSNLVVPRANDLAATNGLAQLVYTMSWVLVFVMWALVAAIPCQDRGLQVNFNIPKHFSWAQPMLSLYDKIMDESKKKYRKNSCGLLIEIYQMERCVRLMSELTDSVSFPLPEEKDGELKQRVQELAQLCGAMKDGLDPLEGKVRDVFNKIVRNRSDGLDNFTRGHMTE
ncbi:hypothetical protein ACFE04_026010 [Oxalis oulophora]